MDTQAVVARIESRCRQLGMDDGLARKVAQEAILPELQALAHERDRLQAERDRMAQTQQEVQKLVQAPTPEKIVHDLRNVLNELSLLRAIAAQDDE